VKAYINGKEINFQEPKTILEAAKENGIFIPTLCALPCINHTPGTCRVCLIAMRRNGSQETQLVTSCDTPLEDGMEVETRSPLVRSRQRLQVELILADHNQDCASCVRHGDCELQDVAQFVGLESTRYTYPHFYQERTKETTGTVITRDMSKCIRCLRCVTVCREIQGTDVLVYAEKGLSAEIGVRDSIALGTSSCVSCGQCTLVCPVGALAVKDDTEKVLDFLYDPKITTVFQIAPAVRVALGEEFRMNPGTPVIGKIVTALKRMGANFVLDTEFTADLVIMEEGSELLERIQNGGKLPLLTSCSPGWINFMEKYYPEVMEHVSTVKSPQQCFGSLAKTYFAQKVGINPRFMKVVSIMPCAAKKIEAARPEFNTMGKQDVDVVLTTREFARLMKREGMWLPDLPDTPYEDMWMDGYSGAAELFGTTGGVMEAALRTVYKLVVGKELEGIEITATRGPEQIKEAVIDLGGKYGKVKVAVAHGLKAARKIVEEIKAGRSPYLFVEIMACPNGCIGGGGQPRTKGDYQAYREERRQAVYALDRSNTIRQSHNNPMIKRIYEDFLEKPLSSKSHHLLHTSYSNKKKKVIHTMKEIWEEIQAI